MVNLWKSWRKKVANTIPPNDKRHSLQVQIDKAMRAGDYSLAMKIQIGEALKDNQPSIQLAGLTNLPATVWSLGYGLQGGGIGGSPVGNPIKVGDRVRCIPAGHRGAGWKLDSIFTVDSVSSTGYGDCLWEKGASEGVYADSVELIKVGTMGFKIGDVVTVDWPGEWCDGLTGTVRGRNSSEGMAVEFSEEDDDGDGHDCANKVPSGHGYWLEEDQLTLVPKVKPRPKIKFSSVIIEDAKRDQILEALEQVNQSKLIFDKWGFGETMEKGKGVSMLFWGPPGTGKTLMAQAISDHLGYTLKVVGVADIESSAPGESERNIRKIFKEAKEAKTVLLFDECDSLIYNRSQVGAILGAQINELLSQIERFEGVMLFTTNRLGILDEAMNRRLALKLEFGMPTLEQRVKIWKRMFPTKAPIEKGVNWAKLAKVEIAGGYIKNTVLRAARMAAIEKVPDKDKRITMAHLIKSLQLEAQSMLEFDEARKTEERPAMVRDYVQKSQALERVSGW